MPETAPNAAEGGAGGAGADGGRRRKTSKGWKVGRDRGRRGRSQPRPSPGRRSPPPRRRGKAHEGKDRVQAVQPPGEAAAANRAHSRLGSARLGSARLGSARLGSARPIYRITESIPSSTLLSTICTIPDSVSGFTVRHPAPRVPESIRAGTRPPGGNAGPASGLGIVRKCHPDRTLTRSGAAILILASGFVVRRIAPCVSDSIRA